MSVRLYVTLSCLVAFSGLALVGCSKKTDQSPPAAKTGAAQSSSAPQASPEISAEVAADLEKPVAEVQTQAQAMSLADLKSMADQYKQAISLKQENLQKILAQVKEIPIAQALGEKAKALKTELQKIETSVKSMTERFQVYYNQLKEKGGDLSGLVI